MYYEKRHFLKLEKYICIVKTGSFHRFYRKKEQTIQN